MSNRTLSATASAYEKATEVSGNRIDLEIIVQDTGGPADEEKSSLSQVISIEQTAEDTGGLVIEETSDEDTGRSIANSSSLPADDLVQSGANTEHFPISDFPPRLNVEMLPAGSMPTASASNSCAVHSTRASSSSPKSNTSVMTGQGPFHCLWMPADMPESETQFSGHFNFCAMPTWLFERFAVMTHGELRLGILFIARLCLLGLLTSSIGWMLLQTSLIALLP